LASGFGYTPARSARFTHGVGWLVAPAGERVVRRGITFGPKRDTRGVVMERRAWPLAPRAGDWLALGA